MYLYVNCQLGKERKIISRYTSDPPGPIHTTHMLQAPVWSTEVKDRFSYLGVWEQSLPPLAGCTHHHHSQFIASHIAGLCCAFFESHDSLPEILLLKVAPHIKLMKTWCVLCRSSKSTLVTMHLALTLKGPCPCGTVLSQCTMHESLWSSLGTKV